MRLLKGTLLIMLMLLTLPRANAQTNCQAPPTLTRNYAWEDSANVTYSIDTAFSSGQRGAIQQALATWTAESAKGNLHGNCSGVAFTPTLSAGPVSGHNSLQIIRNYPDPNNPLADAVTIPFVLPNILDHAITLIHPFVTDPLAVQQRMAHEAGHTFALNDCIGCGDRSSVMVTGNIDPANYNETIRLLTGPTQCDNDTIRTVGQYPCTIRSVNVTTQTTIVDSLAKGDKVTLQATLLTNDPNENGEGEPLVLQFFDSANSTQVIGNYAQPMMFNYLAQSNGASIQGYIQNYDGDELGVATVALNLASNSLQVFSQTASDALAKAAALLNVQAQSNAVAAANAPGGPSPATLVPASQFSLAGWLYQYSAATFLNASLLNRLPFFTPDPSFTIIAQPVVPTLPTVKAQGSLTQAEADAINALLSNQAEVVAVTNALQASINRAQGAANANNSQWQLSQMQAVQQYAKQLATLYGAQPSLRATLQTSLQQGGVPTFYISSSEVYNFEVSVGGNDLPVPLGNTLSQLGVDGRAMDEIRSIAFVQDINATAGDFPSLLVNPTLDAALQSASQALNQIGTITVTIEIKPGDVDGTINLAANGDVPVAILGTKTFDASKVDPTTVTFAGAHVAKRPNGTLMYSMEDVNQDGIMDMVLHFNTQDLRKDHGGQLDTSSRTATLQGQLKDGTAIIGTAPVHILKY